MPDRPSVVTDEMLVYLDNLRISGVTNMYGAGVYLEDEFLVDTATASIILHYWMVTFGKEGR